MAMKDVAGSPGTWGGLALRVSQCVCTAASLVAITTAQGNDSFSAFIFLGISMELQLLWSFCLACLDIHSLRTNMDLRDPALIGALVVMDWIMGINSLAAACASAGLTILLDRDAQVCRAFPHLSCGQFKLSVILAFMAWSFVAASATSSFWLLASLLE